MYKNSLIALLGLILLVNYTQCAVYEASNSDDVEFFVEHSPEENGAIMFYDEIQESTNAVVGENVKKVLGIFLNVGEEGRSTDDWVNSLNDKSHLIRVNAFDEDNSNVVQKFRVSQTPLLVLLDNGKTVFEEVVNVHTYDHVKEMLYKEPKSSDSGSSSGSDSASGSGSVSFSGNDDSNGAQNSAQANTNYYSPSANEPSNNYQSTGSKSDDGDVVDNAEKSLAEAQQMSDSAQKQVDDAQKALNAAKDQIDDYAQLEEAKRMADEAKTAAAEALKKYQEANAQLQERIKKTSESEHPQVQQRPATPRQYFAPQGRPVQGRPVQGQTQGRPVQGQTQGRVIQGRPPTTQTATRQTAKPSPPQHYPEYTKNNNVQFGSNARTPGATQTASTSGTRTSGSTTTSTRTGK